jgi:hypothetical protein
MNGAESLKYQVVGDEGETRYARRLHALSPQTEGLYLIEVLEGAPSAGNAFQAFTRDLATVSLLGHPCVLEVAEVATLADGSLVVISELPPDGLRLSQVVAEGRELSPSAALDIVAGVGDALDAAAERGIAHGAVNVDHVILAGGELGTPRLHGFRQRALREPRLRFVDLRVRDVRDLAKMAELLLTPAELRTSAATRSFGTPAGVSRVITRALGENRFQRAGDFVAALQSSLERDPDGRSVSLVRSDWAIQLPRRRRRAPRLATGIVAGCALSLLGLFAMFQVRHRWTILPEDPAAAAMLAERARAEPVPAPVPAGAAPVVASAAPVVASPAPVVAEPVAEPVPAAPVAAPAAVPAPKVVSVGARGVVANVERKRPRAARDMVWSDHAGRLVPVYENVAQEPPHSAGPPAGGLAP